MRNRKLAMISQPMAGLSDTEITKVRNEAVLYLHNQGYEIVNTYFNYDGLYSDLANDGIKSVPTWFLSKAIDAMAKANCVYFVKGWESALGCQFEHGIAKTYGIPIFYEE
jgi:hypothetical protein